ncbi:DMT family transporter [Actinokineospora guangxiensis]|uniref:DMT family transporter n=1 Tax=Actinokineospora guangxiensis TaxID=1490288 RepID=A0ABW0EHH5_9PSEU
MAGGRGTLVRMGLVALIWGSSFLWTEIALRGLAPVQIAVVRCVLGALVLIGLCYASGNRLPRERRSWFHMGVGALLANALPFTLFAVGQQTVDSGVAGVINATTPLWQLVLGLALGSDRGLGPVRVAGLLLGFLGTLVIFAPWDGSLGWGALVILAAAISYAVAYAYLDRTMKGRMQPIAMSATQLSAAAGLMLLVLPFGGTEPVALSWPVVLAVGVLGVFGTGFAFALFYRLLADEGPTNAAVVGYLLPVVSVLLGSTFLGEPLNARIVAGMAVVLLGVAMTRITRRPAAVTRVVGPTPTATARSD